MANKGLYRDVDFILQPQGTSPYIRNGNLTDDYGALSNEHGTKIFNEISSGYTIVLGSVVLDNKEKVLFLYTPSTSMSKIIRVLNNGNIFNVTNNNTFLNFSKDHQIEATFKVNNLDEHLVYFTDNYNPPRWINVDVANTLTADNIKLQEVFDSYFRPVINLASVNDFGGMVESGVYQAFMAYVRPDGSETEWTSFSNMVSVTIEAGIFKGAAAGTPTTKSITFNLTGLDTQYSRIKVGVIQYNDGVVESPKIFFDGTYTGTTKNVTFTNRESFVQISIEEALTGKAYYTKVKTINQLEDVLYMGNLKQDLDLGLQKFVNNVEVDYVTSTVNIGTSRTNSYMDPIVIFNKRGFQHDEVYALYMSFVLKNGKETKAYVVPGRSAVQAINPETATNLGSLENVLLNSLSGAQLTAMGDYGIYAVPDAINNINSTSRFFQIFDTDNNPNASTNMGYHENQNEQYPNTTDWDVYTVDVNGEPILSAKPTLRNQKVRHHKFPRPQILNSSSANYINTADKINSKILGIQLSNIAIPASVKDQIRGIKVYYAKRSGNNSLVVAQTIGIPQASISQISNSHNYNPTGNYQINNTDSTDTVNANVDWKYVRLTAPAFQVSETGEPSLSSKIINYLKPIGRFLFHNTPAYNWSNAPQFQFGFFSDYQNASSSINNAYNKPNYIKSVRTTQYLPLSTDRPVVSNSSIYDISKSAYLYQVEQSVYIELNSALTNTGPGSYPAKFLDLNDINNTYLVASTTYLPLFNCYQYLEDIYNDFDSQTLVDTGHYVDLTGMSGYILSATSDMFGGDIFMGLYYFRSTNELGAFYNYQFGTYTTPLRHVTGYNFPIQTSFNPRFRYTTSDIYSAYYPVQPLVNGDGSLSPENYTGVLQIASTSNNIYAYNDDYSKVNEIVQPEIFSKIASNETDSFRTRIIRSAKNNVEGIEDNFRSFAVNDYVDLSKNRGQIEKLSKIGDNLIIQLTNSVTKTVAREVLKLDSTNAFLGSGDIFAIPSKEILYTDIGYGGTRSQWSPVATPFGLIYPDITKGKIYNLANGIEEISASGMTTWALDNVKLYINDRFNTVFSTDFPLLDCPASPNGVGFTGAWDDEYRRYLLTKIDYDLTELGLEKFVGIRGDIVYAEGDLVWNSDTNTWQIYRSGIFVDFYTTDGDWDFYFEDKSFTISYYPEFKCFGSFYDFVPYHYIYDNRNVYSIYRKVDSFLTDATKLWEHNNPDTFCQYYTQDKSLFEVDIVYNNDASIPKIFDSFMYSSKFVDTLGNIVPTKTFDYFTVYNSYQLGNSTALTNLTNCRLVNTSWNVSQFRNLRGDYNIPILDSDYTITGIVNNLMPFYQRERMSDKYMVARLRYDNFTEGRLSLQMSSTKDEPKIR